MQFAVIDPVDTGRMYDWNEKGIVKHDSSKQTQEVLIPTSRLVPWTNYTVHVQAQNSIGLSGKLDAFHGHFEVHFQLHRHVII